MKDLSKIHSLGKWCFYVATFFFLITSCTPTSTKENLQLTSASTFMPLQAGKYITYRLDSIVFINFGTKIDTHRYQVKHVIDALIKDDQGRDVYRVYRYIRDTAAIKPWVPNGTYFITPLAQQIEVTEENFRVIKLHTPVQKGFTWKGNRYLASGMYQAQFKNSLDRDDFINLDFNYADSLVPAVNINGKIYTNVITVEQANDVLNMPATNTSAPGFKLRMVEKYSLGIGMVYRQYEIMEYQPTYYGFGVKMWMIDHN